jgi:YidC/Oxa1 family membrane protein insertase
LEEDNKILRVQVFKSLILPVALLGLLAWVVLTPLVTAAPPNNLDVGPVAQKSGVTLEKLPGQETVALGKVVSFTITIKNDGAETINPTLTDPLPNGLALQTKTISATMGLVEAKDSTVFWSGELAQGDEAVIIYEAIPPSTSDPGQILNNVARLEFGGTSLEAGATIETRSPELGIWGRFVNFLAVILVSFDSRLESLNVPYSFGFAIILFTIIVRVATFPLNMQQIKSSKAMQELQPKMKELQAKYKNDREKLAQEQMALYKEHGVNPLGGCLPMLVQMPIWFALYRSLLQLSREGLLNEGFLWIPSLAGPVSDYNQGLSSWLYPFVDGAPPIGWGPAISYMILPVLLVVSQLYMQKMMTPPTDDPQQASMQSVMKFMPLMFGYFALVVPAGLSLYWFTSNILAMAQQYFTKTSLNTAPAPAEAMVASTPAGTTNPVPTESEEEKEEKKQKNVRSKRRKTRRKR